MAGRLTDTCLIFLHPPASWVIRWALPRVSPAPQLGLRGGWGAGLLNYKYLTCLLLPILLHCRHQKMQVKEWTAIMTGGLLSSQWTANNLSQKGHTYPHPIFGPCLLCIDAAKTRNPLKFAGLPQTTGSISAASGPKSTVLWKHVEDTLLLNKFFSDCRYVP